MEIANPMFRPAEKDDSAYERVLDYRDASTGVRAFFVIFLLVALLGAGYFGYLALKKKNVQISQLFGQQTASKVLDQRFDTAEGKLRDLSSGWASLAQRLTAVESFEGRVGRRFEQTREYAQNLTAELHQQVTAEIDARSSSLEARLRQVETDQQVQQSQLTQVQAELRQEIQSVREKNDESLSGVHQEAANNARSLGALSQRLDRERVYFDVSKGRATQVVPGISIQVNRTDNKNQRFRGSLRLLQDQRTVRLRDQGVGEPVRFYYKDGADAYELVVTGVTQRNAYGYFLIPVQQKAATSAGSGQNSFAPTSAPGND
jgi:hypothetical protein